MAGPDISRLGEQLPIDPNLEQFLIRLKAPRESYNYAQSLWEQCHHPRTSVQLEIGRDTFRPSSLLSQAERTEKMGSLDYRTQAARNANYLARAQQTIVTFTSMDAGIGSGVPRESYIAKLVHLLGRGLGSKGCDIHFTIPNSSFGRPLSILEIKAQRYYQEAPLYGQVIIEPLVNPESSNAFTQFLATEIPAGLRRGDGVRTYEDLLNNPGRNISLISPIVQPNFPTIDVASDTLTDAKTAPGGHGYLATLLLERLAAQPFADETPRVRVISNGDGVNNVASPEMVGLVVEEAAAFGLVTAEREIIDLQGGVLGLSRDPSGAEYVDIIELAQAKTAHQEDIFQALGISNATNILEMEHHKGQQYFNTNMAILNEGLLSRFLSKLKAEIGFEELSRLITPVLIKNLKKKDGRDYIQMEGALAAVLLQLNRYVATNTRAGEIWDEITYEVTGKRGKQFMRIINLDGSSRDGFFSPIKNSWDSFLQTASDRYALDPITWTLKNQRSGHHIAVNPQFLTTYKDLHLMLAAFEGTSVRWLDSFTFVQGKAVLLPGAILRGNIQIQNDSGEEINIVPLLPAGLPRDPDGRIILENKHIHITPEGKVEIKIIAP